MGQQVSVETLTANDENSSGKYWTSFEPYPQKVGHRKLAYLGILNGSGPRKGDKCIVKALRNCCATYNDWNSEVKIARLAKTYSRAFSKEMEMKSIRAKLIFFIPMLVEIDEVSSYMCISFFLGKPRKKMKEFEIVAVEPYIDGQFVNFESTQIDFSETVLTSAFSHFTWFHSNGKHVICRLKGVASMDEVCLTSPRVHSRDRKFGANDLGQMGIDNFFANHHCSDICRHWPRPDDHFYRSIPSLREMDLMPFDPKTINFCGQNSEYEPFKADLLLKNNKNRENFPIRTTVHCDSNSGCVCRYFRLPCRHRVEPFTSVVYLMNHGFPSERDL